MKSPSINASAAPDLQAPRSNSEPMLQVTNLKTHFPIEKGLFLKRQIGTVKAVDGVSLTLQPGEIVGLVGESGCGKSTLGRTILQLIPPTEGTVVLAGRHLNELRGRALRRARADFQMIFQDPYASLNPRLTVYDCLAEAITTHTRVPRSELPRRISELLAKVGMSPRCQKKYPHEFSGGQRQRIAIARALAVEPKLIVADEPVSALDVSIQAQILNLIGGLSRELGLTLIFIAHDLSVVKHISDRIAVMYLGRIVEIGPADQVFQRPLHPYTQALASAIPVPDPDRERDRRRMLLPGEPPSPLNPPAGCSFHPRCRYAVAACRLSPPPMTTLDDPNQEAACIRLPEVHSKGNTIEHLKS